jgi:polyhydroxyalkanoate synthesis regulator phasin
MPISAKRKLVAGAAGLAVLAGSGGAYAAGQSTPTASKPAPAKREAVQKAFLDDVAKRLNVTREQLDAALEGAAEARIDAAVAAGDLTKEQGEAAKRRIASGAPLWPGPGGPRFGGPGHGHGPGLHFGFGGFADAATEYLGLSERQLREQLRDGKSLADVAKDRNKSIDGLKAAIKAQATERLDDAVKNGDLTQSQRDELASKLDDRIDDIVNRDAPGRPAGPRFRWR